MGVVMFAVWYELRLRLQVEEDRERGDVPGWVLITLMTAGIVTALWLVAEPTLRNLLTNALNITGDPNK
jgi:predicted outer membrane lipoprotein